MAFRSKTALLDKNPTFDPTAEFDLKRGRFFFKLPAFKETSNVAL